MAFLKPDKITVINGVTVKQFILTEHNDNKIQMPHGERKKTVAITIHNTDAITPASGTTMAEQYTRATYYGNMKDVRVQLYVDDKEAWLCMPLDYVNWSCADGCWNSDGTLKENSGNNTSIAIEIIGNSAKAEDNGARLAAYLIKEYGLTVDSGLRTHTYWLNVLHGKTGIIDQLNVAYNTYKNCPIYIIPHWSAFKDKVKQYYDVLGGTTSNTPEAPVGYTKTLVSGTPIYAEIGKPATGKIAATTRYTIVQEKTVNYVKYGKLKSGVGWVELEKIKRTFDINNADDVKELQTALNKNGFNCGIPDGIIGDKTQNAMFQALCEQWLQVK